MQTNCSDLKHILALPIRGQKCIVSQLFQFLSVNFDLGHPVFSNTFLEKYSNLEKSVAILLLTTVLAAEKRKLIGLPSGKGEHMLKEDQMLEKDTSQKYIYLCCTLYIKNTRQMTKLKQWSIWLSLDFSTTSVVVVVQGMEL